MGLSAPRTKDKLLRKGATNCEVKMAVSERTNVPALSECVVYRSLDPTEAEYTAEPRYSEVWV